MNGQVKCTNFCEKAPQNPAAQVCGIVGVAHSTDYPFPGWVWQQSFQFMLAASRSDSARKASQYKAVQQKSQQVPGHKKASSHQRKQAPGKTPAPAGKPGQKKPAAAAAAAAAGGSGHKKVTAAAARQPLALQLTFPGEQQLSQWRSS